MRVAVSVCVGRKCQNKGAGVPWAVTTFFSFPGHLFKVDGDTFFKIEKRCGLPFPATPTGAAAVLKYVCVIRPGRGFGLVAVQASRWLENQCASC